MKPLTSALLTSHCRDLYQVTENHDIRSIDRSSCVMRMNHLSMDRNDWHLGGSMGCMHVHNARFIIYSYVWIMFTFEFPILLNHWECLKTLRTENVEKPHYSHKLKIAPHWKGTWKLVLTTMNSQFRQYMDISMKETPILIFFPVISIY